MHSLTNQDVYCMCPVVKHMMLSRRFQYSLRSIFYLVIFPDHIFAVSERMRIYSLITVYTVVPDSLKTRVGQVSVSTAYNWQQWQTCFTIYGTTAAEPAQNWHWLSFRSPVIDVKWLRPEVLWHWWQKRLLACENVHHLPVNVCLQNKWWKKELSGNQLA